MYVYETDIGNTAGDQVEETWAVLAWPRYFSLGSNLPPTLKYKCIYSWLSCKIVIYSYTHEITLLIDNSTVWQISPFSCSIISNRNQQKLTSNLLARYFTLFMLSLWCAPFYNWRYFFFFVSYVMVVHMTAVSSCLNNDLRANNYRG